MLPATTYMKVLPRACSVGALLSALALFSACGGRAAGGSLGSARAPEGGPPASAAAACKSSGRTVCITSSANGHEVEVKVGWTLAVDLHAPGMLWSDPVELGARLLREIGPVRRNGGAVEVRYRTVAPGRTDLRAFERPVCRPRRVCPQFIVVWEVHLRVSGH